MEALLDANHWRVDNLLTELIQSAEERSRLQLIEMLKPSFSKDGDQYCYLLGANLQEGISGFGKTVSEAVQNFYYSYYNAKA